jgi:hypothetical protein
VSENQVGQRNGYNISESGCRNDGDAEVRNDGLTEGRVAINKSNNVDFKKN